MHYVKPTEAVIGPMGHTPFDPVRRDRLPAGTWRPVQYSPYWQRLAVEGSVVLTEREPPADQIEGYEPPADTPPDVPARRGKGE